MTSSKMRTATRAAASTALPPISTLKLSMPSVDHAPTGDARLKVRRTGSVSKSEGRDARLKVGWARSVSTSEDGTFERPRYRRWHGLLGDHRDDGVRRRRARAARPA